MSCFLNYKICDNAEECSGIEVCPVKAITWNKEQQQLDINNDKCISCGLCEKACPIGAFKVAKNKEEAIKIQQEIENDSRTTKDLFVDRYGAVAISEFFKIKCEEIEAKVKKDCITLIEIYNPDVAECLLKSIPIKDLTKNFPTNTLYYKVENDKTIDKYQLKKLPALLLFQSGNFIGHIDGYYSIDDKEKLLSKLDSILKYN